MGEIIANMSVSLDGFVAGPDDEVDDLFRWYFSGDVEVPLAGTDIVFRVSRRSADYIGATWPGFGAMVTGRRNFDHAKAWGGRPPGGGLCFVVTHSVPERWVYEGSPFAFVTEGIESAVAQAREAAGDKHVDISTATMMRQCLEAGLLDEIRLSVAPVLLGEGVRLFGETKVGLERTLIVEAPGVTHLQFRVSK